MQPKIELAKTRDFGEIINDTFTFIGQNWKPLLKSYVIICGFFIVANLIVALLQEKQVINAIQTPTSPYSVGYNFGYKFRSMFGLTYILSMVFSLFALTSLSLLPLSFMALYKEKGNVAPNIEEVWGYFKHYFFRVLGTNIVIGVVFIIAFALCLIPGVYLFPILSLILPIIVFENVGLGYSWSKSFQLIKENWWQTFGAIVVMVIITYAAMMVFVLPATLFSVGTLFLSKTKPSSSAFMLTTIVSALCYVFYMLPSITAALCYFNLNEQKEGTGLMNRINNFGNNNLDAGLPKEEY